MIQEIRTAIFDLHGPSSGTTRLRQRIDEAVAQFSSSDLRTTVQFSGPLSVVDAILADHAEAVVREAVSNAVRHSHAKSLSISVSAADDFCIEVADDGRGIDGDISASWLEQPTSTRRRRRRHVHRRVSRRTRHLLAMECAAAVMLKVLLCSAFGESNDQNLWMVLGEAA